MKPEHKTLVRARAERAIADLYHNATPTYPRELYGRSEDDAQAWFQDVAELEIEYLADGGSTPGDYRATLAAPCNAGKYASPEARIYYIRKGMRAREEERADCGALTGWRALEYAVMAAGGKVGGVARARLLSLRKKYPDMTRNNAQWERIAEYGKLYSWGRGGRTLAPNDLVYTGGGSSFSLKADCNDRSIADCMDLIRVIESFNAHVERWCRSVPEQWREWCADEDAQALADKRAESARKAKETRERRYWEARDVCTI